MYLAATEVKPLIVCMNYTEEAEGKKNANKKKLQRQTLTIIYLNLFVIAANGSFIVVDVCAEICIILDNIRNKVCLAWFPQVALFTV